MTLFDSGTNLSFFLASFPKIVVAYSSTNELISSSAIVWGFLEFAAKHHLVWFHQQWSVNILYTHPHFGRVARVSKRPLFARKIFQHGPQHWSRPIIFRGVFAADVASNLRWRKLFHIACTESSINVQFFRCKWNQNERGLHSISFSSTWRRIMIIIRN